MKKNEFEAILENWCSILTREARESVFESSVLFEGRVRELMSELAGSDSTFTIDFSPRQQAFPDIAMGDYGVEVKFTSGDTWRSVGNSILETQRIESVKYIYIIFGKMGGTPEVRWADYEQSIVHVRTSHVPRFEVDISVDEAVTKKPLFEEMGIRYDDFRKLPMQEKMRYVRAYARQMHPEGRLWWIEDKGANDHSVPLQPRLYTSLATEEKIRLRAEAALLCPKIVSSGRVRNKYTDAVFFLLTYHGVVCHQARDLFSAGSVASPKNDSQGGVFIEKALKLIEKDIREAAERLDDALFEEYWGENVAPKDRIKKWLEKADKHATDWKPSASLFLDESS